MGDDEPDEAASFKSLWLLSTTRPTEAGGGGNKNCVSAENRAAMLL